MEGWYSRGCWPVIRIRKHVVNCPGAFAKEASKFALKDPIFWGNMGEEIGEFPRQKPKLSQYN